MTTYIVKLTINSLVYEEYLDWLLKEHAPEVLKNPGFLEAELLLERHDPEHEKSHIDVLYRLKSRADLDLYLKNAAPILRQKGVDRWGTHFTAVREIWDSSKKILQTDLHAQQKLSYIDRIIKEARMAYQLDVKKLIKDLRGPKGVAALTEEIAKVSSEILKLRNDLQPQAEAKVKEARATLDFVQKRLKAAQNDLDKELGRTLTLVKKYGKEAEQGFQKIKVAVTKKKAGKPARKATKKTATKKVAKKK